MSLLGDWDEIFENDIKKLNEFRHIDRLDEVISILRGLRHDEFFKGLANLVSDGKKSLFDSRNVWEFKDEGNSFFSLGIRELKSRSPIYLPPLTKFVNDSSFLAMYAILELSYVYDSGHKLTDDELKSIVFGDIGQFVTFFVEDFDKSEKLPKISADFFKRLKDLYWEDKKAKKLHGKIYDVIRDITTENSTPYIFTRTFIHSIFYLEACNALKYGRDVVTCDDVVIAYLTTFKILMSDIRLLVPLINIE
ncbi:hypothetical protein MBCUT_00200 [Methanobrevibacter cuticularis]|uniref:Uncharacterized protein n=1 Tax=Methanobrevibacter cuticularis TaxID=47311 RepID=A0A166FLS8_9EURY|nr:hypothetical protein [Methanobrevibacter cuticularis]KZX17809.1 hypothetical protein MBCUT_00200 [Methanobrevibacter cuticularis]